MMENPTSADDLMTSQSIERRDFSDFEMLDSQIGSALKKIISNQHFRRRVSVEEQIAHMIYDHFRATGAYDSTRPIKSFQYTLQGDDIQDFDTTLDQALLSASERRRTGTCEVSFEMEHRRLRLKTQ